MPFCKVITGWPKEKGRDGERTPMQWDASNRQAGFSAAPHTWLPVADDYTTINVASETKDPDSLLHWYEQLIRMRRDVPALRDGGLEMLDSANPNVLSYVRTASPGSRPVVVALNMTGSSQTVSLQLPGQAAATRIGEVVTSHIIARPHANVENVLPLGRAEQK